MKALPVSWPADLMLSLPDSASEAYSKLITFIGLLHSQCPNSELVGILYVRFGDLAVVWFVRITKLDYFRYNVLYEMV